MILFLTLHIHYDIFHTFMIILSENTMHFEDCLLSEGMLPSNARYSRETSQ